MSEIDDALASIPERALPLRQPSATCRRPTGMPRRNCRSVRLPSPTNLIKAMLVMSDTAVLLAVPLIAALPWQTALVLAAADLVLIARGDLHRPRLAPRALDTAPAIALRTAAAIAITVPATAANQVDRMLPVAAECTLAMVAARALCYRAIASARRAGLLQSTTLIVGAGRVSGELAHRLLEHPEYGMRPIGFLDSDPLLPPDERPLPVLGTEDELTHLLGSRGINEVLVGFGAGAAAGIVEQLRACDRLGCEVRYVPRLFELAGIGKEVEHLWGIPLQRLSRGPHRSFGWRLKRPLDVASAGIGLLATLPLIAISALATRSENGPGVLFRQHRIGQDGRPFLLLKLRSFTPTSAGEAATRWSIATDRRMGRVGRFIRRTGVDELPQLWNILRGEMSLVGPRPERPFFVRAFEARYPLYRTRHQVPVGLTGLAQVYGLRGDTSIEERARFDNLYVRSWSLWLDLKIIMWTITAAVRMPGHWHRHDRTQKIAPTPER